MRGLAPIKQGMKIALSSLQLGSNQRRKPQPFNCTRLGTDCRNIELSDGDVDVDSDNLDDPLTVVSTPSAT